MFGDIIIELLVGFPFVDIYLTFVLDMKFVDGCLLFAWISGVRFWIMMYA